MHPRAAQLVAALDLAPHPEGGHYREIHRSSLLVTPEDGRPRRSGLTVIYFLLVSGTVTRWHRIPSDESWHFLEGSPVALHEATSDFARISTKLLGPYGKATEPTRIIPGGCWQAARTTGEYSLVNCAVGPGFDFDDLEMLHQSQAPPPPPGDASQ
jgi:uncharacterized protein